MGFELVCARTRGASHVKNETPCEDYGLVACNDCGQVFVLSDGHGDSSCPRSDVGSRLACEIASAELLAFGEQLEGLDARMLQDDPGHVTLILDADRQASVVRQLVNSILGKWSSAVGRDVRERPLKDEELAGCSERYRSLYQKGERLEHIYGATLIAGLMTDKYLLLLQQGDGRCDVFDATGAVSQPIPWDARCTANVTTSLCDEDAVRSTRYCVIDRSKTDVAAVLAGSDGVEDAFFSMDQTHSFYRDLLIRAADTSVDELQEYLTAFLPEFSEKGTGGYGSQDDVTVCGMIDMEKVRAFRAALELANEEVSLRSSLKSVEDRLMSMSSGKMEFLRRRVEEARRREQDAKAKRDQTEERLRVWNEHLRGFMSGKGVLRLTDGSSRTLAGQEAVLWAQQHIARLNKALDQESMRFNKAEEQVRAALEELEEYAGRNEELKRARDAYRAKLAALLKGGRSDAAEAAEVADPADATEAADASDPADVTEVADASDPAEAADSTDPVEVIEATEESPVDDVEEAPL